MAIFDIEKFSGEDPKTPLSQWLKSVALAMEMNSWGAQKTLKVAQARTFGEAAHRIEKVQINYLATPEQLISEIRKAFVDTASAKLRYQEAMAEGMRRNESVDALSARVRAIVTDVQPELFSETIAVSLFTNMLTKRDKATAKQLFKMDPTTLAEATRIAQHERRAERWSAIVEQSSSGALPQPVPAFNYGVGNMPKPVPAAEVSSGDMEIDQMWQRNSNSNRNMQNLTCYYCKQRGHITDSCFKLKKVKEQIKNMEETLRARRNSYRNEQGPSNRRNQGQGFNRVKSFRLNNNRDFQQRRQEGGRIQEIEELDQLAAKIEDIENDDLFDEQWAKDLRDNLEEEYEDEEGENPKDF